MSLPPRSSQSEIESDLPGKAEKSDSIKEDILPSTPRTFSINHSSECQTLHDEKGVSGSKDVEKAVVQPTGKYAKYAGEPPDGGLKAWTVILATALTTCSAFGYVNAWGIFQAYYEEVLLPNKSPSDIAWIGSVQYALVFLPGLVTGRLFDLGYFKIPYFMASCLLVACTFLTAECKEYWQFFLAQGIGLGLACGVLFGPALGIVSHWFSKRRGLALGVNAVGSSVGGTIFPILAQNLIPQIGFKWTLRVFGFILIGLLGVANITIDRRLPPSNMKGGLFNWAALKNPAYAVYCVSGITTFLGLYTVLTYIPVSAVQVGIPNDFAFYLIAIANGSSAFGRIFAGIIADRVGALNVMIPFTVIAAAMTFLWPFITSKSGLIGISVIYGFSCGTYVSLLAVPAMAMGAVGDVGRRTGLYLSFAAFGALSGPPISGAINSATGGFEDVGWWYLAVFGVLVAVDTAPPFGQALGKILTVYKYWWDIYGASYIYVMIVDLDESEDV